MNDGYYTQPGDVVGYSFTKGNIFIAGVEPLTGVTFAETDVVPREGDIISATPMESNL